MQGLLKLEFPLNEGGEDEGLGHAGIETFRHAPYASVARETGQNSRDAAATLPVRITFDVFSVSCEEVPGIADLQWTVAQCSREVSGEKESAFFRQAQEAVTAPKLRILRIADFNTTGAKGPSVKGTPFHSLLKGSGVSVKADVASGGSFGIGKNAVFAVSDVQTVFFSTAYQSEGGGIAFLAQGKTILVSHTGSDGKPRRQAGYWGRPNFEPVADQTAVPAWLRRSESGTSLYILAFRETADWQRTFACSLMQNFFPAIAAGEMEFSIDGGQIVLTRSSIAGLFSDPGMLQTAEKAELAQDFLLARDLHECLTSSDAKEEPLELPELGRVRVRVLVREGLAKKIFIARNGMVIADSLEHFGDKFARFPMYKDFVALVMPAEAKGSAFIKKLEDPKHRELSSERLPDMQSREWAKAVMKILAKRIREAVKSHTLADFDKEVAADEMRKYFEGQRSGADSRSESSQPDPATLRYQVRPTRRKPPSGTETGQQADTAGIGGDSPGAGPHAEGERSGTPGGRSDRSRQDGKERGMGGALKVKDVRNIMIGELPSLRRIFFTPVGGGEVEVTLFAVGLNSAELLSLARADQGNIVAGRLRTSVSDGTRVQVDVEIEGGYLGPIDLTVTYRAVAAEGGAAYEN